MASIDVSHSCTNIAIWYIVNDVIPVLPFLSSQCLTLGWLCCIASYDGLKIKKIANISSLLFWYL
ncbi:hypothetical protein [Wolbachia endosymbiont (group A) of Epistrophe grossularia]|uniref:hypothetical protein n=1 Tax=Wolbachia endosymbiont (group A) of Epistrophe grossularia TaxID=2954008 RepID=UPI002232925C|nr:hypothetical protein [Wolbachia endosymbiont (group A) of Epistrophe grossularia]